MAGQRTGTATLAAMTTLRILMVRHGQSEWNARGRWQGQADPPLSPLGREQAARAAMRIATLSRFDAVVSSDLMRAHHTARLIAQELGVEDVHVDARLRENHAGEWQGLTHAEIERDWPGYLDAGRRPPAFEDPSAVLERTNAAISDLADGHLGGGIVIVSHSGTIRTLVRSVTGRGPRLANLAGVWLHWQGGDLVVGDEVHPLADETFTAVE
jgi:broad specificity phosphatase PhoE